MESQLSEKAQEAEKLNEELSVLDKNSTHSQALSDRLMLNQQQVADLKRKQAELTRLSSHASRNESQIARLSKEVMDMKHKKVELQKQIATERKNHAQEVQKLKKESMQQQRELNKVKQQKEQKTIEAEKAQQVAKSRLDQVIQLKSRYKESEKRLRILTVKRGVMSRAGLDPIMVGRRQTRGKSGESSSDPQSEEGINIDALRDFFDQKVADVSRREALAEKLAQEWEDHLELSSQRDEIIQNGSGEEDVQESLDSLESRIKFKEERIRQLASRLGKPRKDTEADSRDDEQFLFTKDFERQVGGKSLALLRGLYFLVLTEIHRAVQRRLRWFRRRLPQIFCSGWSYVKDDGLRRSHAQLRPLMKRFKLLSAQLLKKSLLSEHSWTNTVLRPQTWPSSSNNIFCP